MNNVYTGPYLMWKEMVWLKKKELKGLVGERAHIKAILAGKHEAGQRLGLKEQIDSANSLIEFKKGRLSYLKKALNSILDDLIKRLMKKGLSLSRYEAMCRLQDFHWHAFWDVDKAYEGIVQGMGN